MMELGQRTRVEGSDELPRFYVRLTTNNRRTNVETSWMVLDRLNVFSNHRGVYLSIPIDSVTRQKLDDVETFVKDNVKIPNELLNKGRGYKPLHRSETMNVLVNDPCDCFVYQANKEFDIVSLQRYKNRRARYKFNIGLTNVYIGPHRDGSSVSIVPYIAIIDVEEV